MKSNKKIGILVPDGVGVRNYLYSKVIENIEHNIIILHNFNHTTIEYIKAATRIANDVSIIKYKEQVIEKFYRELIHKARLKWNANLVNNPTILNNYNPVKKKIKNQIFYFFVDFFTLFINSYNTILFLEKQYSKSLKKNNNYFPLEKQLSKLNLDVILCTHQRAINAPVIFHIAKKLNIKTITVIYSWDNIPKARLALKADKYLVWSEYMKNELRLFYPEIEDRKIIVTGTPQFEFSLNKDNIIDKEIFYKTYKLDSKKINICFSANDTSSPYEVLYLNDLIENLKRNNAFEKYQLLFRINPTDSSGRFNELLKQNKDIIKNIHPKWNSYSDTGWTSSFPTIEDVKLLTSTCYYSDIVINIGSTMIFDFSAFNKPCIYIKYNQNQKWNIYNNYNFQHFRSMPNKKCVSWVYSRHDYFKVIEDTLRKKLYKNEWFEIVVNNYDNASTLIQNILMN